MAEIRYLRRAGVNAGITPGQRDRLPGSKRTAVPEQLTEGQPAVVTLPSQIDLTNAGPACDLLDAAFAAGAPVVIADFTATAFCDCSAMRALLAAGHRGTVCGAQFRLAIPPGTMVRRLADLLGLDRLVPVYPGPVQAAAGQDATTGQHATTGQKRRHG